MRANIHAQISLALNRIYTEWYRSKGYPFEITNSTSYDQYFVYGRTVFDVMVRLTDDIFNTYVRKTGTINPYYTEYCDGKSVTCPGMKQWGTVTLANNGYSALRILQYYYGSNTEIVRTSNIRSIPQSYPGSPLREGDRGINVSVLQRQLNRIAKDYPFFGTLAVDGIFGPAMTQVVKRFQKQFNLTQDGVVGRQTWYKISYIYVSVKDLAELTSEGETANGQLSGGSWGGVTLRNGSSGSAVQQLQYWLNVLAQYDASIPNLTVDGQFGAGTEASVRAFQRKYGLTVDGVVGQTTWNAIYARYQSAQSDTGSAGNAYPGNSVSMGDRGNTVKLVQFWLRMARTNYSSLPNVTVDGVFGSSTRSAVIAFQNYFGLTADGVVGRTTWNKLREVYTGVANKLLSASLRPGQFPGTLRSGSTGTAVRELQYYLYTVAAYENSVPSVTIDGSFGTATENAVRAFQRLRGLTVDGVVGQTTWNALYSLANGLRSSGPVVTVERVSYPGEAIGKGDSGPAVLYYSTLLERIAFYYPEVQSPGRTELYTEQLRECTYSLQRFLGLPESGVVDERTWQAAEALSLSLLANVINENAETRSIYPGYAADVGSAGANVQQIQKWQNQIAQLYAPEAYVPEDGVYSEADKAWIAKFQADLGLLSTGVVDEETWYELKRIAEGGEF